MINVNLADILILNPDTGQPGTPGGQKQGGKEDEGGVPGELENPDEVPKVEFDDSDKQGPGIERGFSTPGGDTGKQYTTQSSLGDAGTISEITRKWERLAQESMSRGMSGLGDKAKNLLRAMTSKKSKVNWKKELKKFFDFGFDKFEDVLPNRRHLGRGDVLYGTRKAEKESVRKLVVAIDTSSSISKKQCEVFLNECQHLGKMFDFDEMIIIYCSDDIGVNGKGGIERIKKGQKISMGAWASTGGNAKGFAPPFAWCQDNKILPSAFIYLTDTGGAFPAVTQFGIPKYKNKVFWFICTASDYTIPPFGRYSVIPMDRDGNFT
jgi:hypothetical protein